MAGTVTQAMSERHLATVVQGIAPSGLCENNSGLIGPVFWYSLGRGCDHCPSPFISASFLSLVPSDLVSYLIF